MSYRIEFVASPYGEYATGESPWGLPYYGVGVYDVPIGTTVAFKALPLPGYDFVKYILDTDYGNDGTWDASRDYSTSAENSFLSNTANIGFRITPIFAYVGTYTLTVLISIGGTMSPAPGAYQYNLGDVVTLTATPSAGYKFSHWLVDDVDVGSENPTTLIMDASYTVQAVFISTAVYTLIMASSPYGVYDTEYGLGEGTYVFPAGTAVQFRIIPDAGYAFTKWVLETDYSKDGTWDDIRDWSTANPSSFSSGSGTIAFRITPVLEAVVTLSYSSNPPGIPASVDGTILSESSINLPPDTVVMLKVQKQVII